MIATKADVREELDRLAAHVAQARHLIGQGGADRPPARFSRAGAQSRSQYVVRQGERCRTDEYRPGAQSRGRAIPRAGAERGIDHGGRRGENRKRIARRGLMFVLSSPSGAGKTTLSRLLLKADRKVELSVSVTTRPKRPGEVDGRDYHFIDRAPLRRHGQERTNLLEWAEVFGHRYGTPRRPVIKALRGRPRCFVRYRLAGHAAASRKSARRSGQRVHPAADGAGTGAAAQDAGRRTARPSSARAWPRPAAR